MDWFHPPTETGLPTHTVNAVYAEMLLTICREYRTLPDPRTLTLAEIRFHYAPLRQELRERTAPRKK